jgi:DNA primase
VAGRIPEGDIRAVLDAVDIAELVGQEVELKRSGSGLKGLCPFHDEKTPSFHVSPDRGTYHCFGCGQGGNAIGWVMERLGMSFPEAVRHLADQVGIRIHEVEGGEAESGESRARVLDALAWAARFFAKRLGSPEAKEARAYLTGRGFRRETVLEWGIGYAPDAWDELRSAARTEGFGDDVLESAGLVVRRDEGRPYDRFRGRLMFPIGDVAGRIVGFGARILGPGEPKYLNSPDGPLFHKGRTLFGLDRAKETIRRDRQAVLVEGYTDVLMAHQAGRRDCVAGLGTALTQDHARVLRRFAERIVLLYDGDEAGREAARRALGVFLQEEVETRIALLPEGRDPCDLAREGGAEALGEVLRESAGAAEFLADQVARQGGGPEARSAALDEALALIAPVQNPVRRELLLKELEERAEVTRESLGARLRSRRTPSRVRERPVRLAELPDAEAWALESALVDPESRMRTLADAPLVSSSARRIVDRAVTLLEEGTYSPATLLAGLEPDEVALVTRLAREGEEKSAHDRQFLDSLERMRQDADSDLHQRLADAIRRRDHEAVSRYTKLIRGRSA